MRIYLIHQYSLVRNSLKVFLSEHFSSVKFYETGNFTNLSKLLITDSVDDLIIMDGDALSRNGFCAIKLFRQDYPLIPLIILSGMYEDISAQFAIEMGASAFVSKTVDDGCLLDAIKYVREANENMIVTPTSPPQAGLRELSDGELNILRKMLQGYGNKQIARELLLNLVTLKNTIQKIYDKLGVSNRAQAIKKFKN